MRYSTKHRQVGVVESGKSRGCSGSKSDCKLVPVGPESYSIFKFRKFLIKFIFLTYLWFLPGS